jgi:hypothetical protein
MNSGSTQNVKSFEILMNMALLFVGGVLVVPIFLGAYFQKEHQSQADAEVLAYQILQIHQKLGPESMTSELEMTLGASHQVSPAEGGRGPASVQQQTLPEEAKTNVQDRQIGKNPWGHPYHYKIETVSGHQQIKIWSTGPHGKNLSHDQVAQSFAAGPNTFVQIFE